MHKKVVTNLSSIFSLRDYSSIYSSGELDGMVDEVAVYGVALSQPEIDALYRSAVSSVVARDNQGNGNGTQTGDQVVITFDGPTWGRNFVIADIDNILQLSVGHSWLSVSGTIGNYVWDSDVYSNDTLIVNLSADGGPPTITVGDTVTLDGVTLWDKSGRPMAGSGSITGDFSNLPPYQPTAVSPEDEAVNQPLRTELRSNYFGDQDSGFYNPASWDNHYASQWQVSTLSSDQFENGIVYSTGADTNSLTAHTLSNSLVASSRYYWRLRHQDDNRAWSDYSQIMSYYTTHIPYPPVATFSFDPVETLICSNATPPDPDTGVYGDYLEASQWRIKLKSDTVYSASINYLSDPSTDITSHTVFRYLSTNNEYNWQVRVQDNNDAWSDWSQEQSFDTTGLNYRPEKPTNISPTLASGTVSRSPRLTASVFSDRDTGDYHLESQWQITTLQGDYSPSNRVYNSGPVSEQIKYEHTVLDTLDKVDSLYWRVRYKDNRGEWSYYSDETSFTTNIIYDLNVCASGCNYATIQNALNAANDGDTILVHDGTYEENIDFNNQQINLTSLNGPDVTTIDGSSSSSSVVTGLGAAGGAELNGFTITGGNPSNGLGGGINVEFNTATITNCIITGNSASYGGGIRKDGSSVVTVTNCIIYSNSSPNGGGMMIQGANSIVTNCIIYSNNSGIHYDAGAGNTITNSTIVDNDNHGINLNNYNPAGNPMVVMKNCIVWSNTNNSINGETDGFSPTYSDIYDDQDWSGGTGNITTDPLFVDAAAGNYHLQSDSPCIDTGTDSGAPADDIEGGIRPIDGPDADSDAEYDMGAYEYGGGGGNAPVRPTNNTLSSPTSLMPTLNANVFSDADNDSHLASRWKIRKGDGAYGDNDSYDSGTSGDLTFHTLSAGDSLIAGVLYYWRVQYRDDIGAWSNWSIETSFTTQNP